MPDPTPLPSPRTDLLDPVDLPPRNPVTWPKAELRAGDPLEWGTTLTGDAEAAIVVSDLHMSDGSVGDDFMAERLIRAPPPDDPLFVGNPESGPSRTRLLARAFTYALDRLADRGVDRVDVVLNGDVFDYTELLGRGSRVSSRHDAFFDLMAGLDRAGHDVHYIRGNHDFHTPPGPWTIGEGYVNEDLRLLAEHGDRYDTYNWPPGWENKGSRWVSRTTSIREVEFDRHAETGEPVYWMAGLDNTMPAEPSAFLDFLGRRSQKPIVEQAYGVVDSAIRSFIGDADDRGVVEGGLERRTEDRFEDWLVTHGHTHIPVSIPGTYYNTASWTSQLVLEDGREQRIDRFPLLLVYPDGGRRREEYVVVEEGDEDPVATPYSADEVQEWRARLGYRSAPGSG